MQGLGRGNQPHAQALLPSLCLKDCSSLSRGCAITAVRAWHLRSIASCTLKTLAAGAQGLAYLRPPAGHWYNECGH